MQAIAIGQQNLVNDLVYLYVYEVTNSAACISIGVIFYPIGNIWRHIYEPTDVKRRLDYFNCPTAAIVKDALHIIGLSTFPCLPMYK